MLRTKPAASRALDVICIDVLAAAVGVMQEPFGRLAAPQGVPEGGQGQAGVQGRRAGPADDRRLQASRIAAKNSQPSAF
jgi:hypothetical protein